MGGRIGVTTRPGKGTEFSFELTLDVDPSPSHVAPIDSSMGGLDVYSDLSAPCWWSRTTR